MYRAIMTLGVLVVFTAIEAFVIYFFGMDLTGAATTGKVSGIVQFLAIGTIWGWFD